MKQFQEPAIEVIQLLDVIVCSGEQTIIDPYGYDLENSLGGSAL